MIRQFEQSITKQRNSSIELLRIISMLMIIARHYVGANAFDVTALPLSKRKIILEAIIYPSGKIGVVIFFFISAWFLCSANTSIIANLRKMWILEREILFWSLVLCGLTFAFNRHELTASLVIQSVFPTLTGLWWYPTSYCLFLLFLPFLTSGLRSIGKEKHKQLCIIIVIAYFVIVGFLSVFISAYVDINLDITTNNVVVFLIYYPLITYYRWYLTPFNRKISLYLIFIGYAILILFSVISGSLFHNSNIFQSVQTHLGSTEYMLPVALTSTGLFTLFQSFHFSNTVINFIANRTFAIYLIHLYPPINSFLWTEMFNMEPIWNSNYFWNISLFLVCIIFLICGIADSIRYCVFAIFFDRHKGLLFDSLTLLIIQKFNVTTENLSRHNTNR